jgi:phosphoenolpyruvate phosphomutase
MILNSGVGSRLGELTKDKPKALLEVGGKTLLGHQIECLQTFGINRVVITTGPFEEKIRKFVNETYPDLDSVFVKNPNYQSTNYIYSMFLAKEEVDDDIILLHGDLFFTTPVLKKLLNDKHNNCVLVNKEMPLPQKDFKAVLKEGRVVKIGVEFFGENTFFSAPFYKFTKKDFLLWLDEIGRHVTDGNVKVYAENAFNEISDRLPLYPTFFNEETCMEIDTKEDLEKANSAAEAK